MSTHPLAWWVTTLVLVAGTGGSAGVASVIHEADGATPFFNSQRSDAYQSDSVPKVDLIADTVTISGVSAGGFMATQFQIAFSSLVRGSLIVAGGPYLCAGVGGVWEAEACMNAPDVIPVETLIAAAVEAELSLQIDSLSNLKHHFTTLYSGQRDSVVARGSMVSLQNMMQHFGVPLTQTTTVYDVPSEHAWITSQYGNDCDYKGEPYVNNCGVDLPGQFFNTTFGGAFGIEIEPKADVLVHENMFTFSQARFGAVGLLNSLNSEGFIYIPTECQGGHTKCHLHINFHGCLQYHKKVGDAYVTQTQLNEWAETNRIVILYPQTTSLPGFNPKGCFDWWGYTGPAYPFKEGKQLSIIHRIAKSLLEKGQV